MNKVTINLENCYGIKKLQKEFNFSETNAIALYAPNGVMKSSLAETFQDAAEMRDSQDRIFPNRETVRKITDDLGNEVEENRILVVLPHDKELGVSEETSTLLLDKTLKREYDNLLRYVAAAKSELLKALKDQSKSKQNMETEISRAIMSADNRIDDALVRLKIEVEDKSDTLFSDIHYDTIFDEKVLEALNTGDLKSSIREYANRYTELLDTSTFFKKGTFDYYNANQIAKSLTNNGFFKANHTVKLNADTGNQEIENKEQLEQIILQEKEGILSDKTLRQNFDKIAKQLERNAQLRKFYDYVVDNEEILSRLHNPEELRQDVLKAYLKINENLYIDWMTKHDDAKDRLIELEEEAENQRTHWENVIGIFNERFIVPFELVVKNRTEVLLGQTSIMDLGFEYRDGEDRAEINRDKLLQSISTGESKALYVLNVIFEIETRKSTNQETFVVIDDLADSFDYRNKYAIIQYLKEISEDARFKMLIMTHNFDFFRTIESRFVGYSNCFMATKDPNRISIEQASGVRNIFANDWKNNFFSDPKKKLASIPFLRNLVEMTVGKNDRLYNELTSMLHWKSDTDSIKVERLDKIFNEICKESNNITDSKESVYSLLMNQVESCLVASDGINFENKIVLSIAIRLQAERFMTEKLSQTNALESFGINQTFHLMEKFKTNFPEEVKKIEVLERVCLMTPENLHVNSFMYEPIIDMSDDHLRDLFTKIKHLTELEEIPPNGECLV